MATLFNKCKEYTLYRDSIEAGIYPYFHELQSGQAPEVIMEGKRRIMLGSNNYLGLTMHPDVIRAGLEALEKYGSGCSGSRFLNGNLDLHNILEKELAEFVGKEACVLLSTGFQTNLGIISAVAGRHDYIISDKENHASIYAGCDLSYAETIRYRHNDMDDLEKRLQKLPREAGKLIVTDGVFSMSGEICMLPEITELAKRYNAATMVDDAHGFGVLGRGGRGTADHFGLTEQTDIIMSTFSKSLASIGGFMAADQYIIDYVRHNSRPFIFSASIPPASAASALAALRIIKAHPEIVERLGSLSDYMRAGLAKRGVEIKTSSTPIIPFYTYDMMTTLTAAKKMFDEGVYVNPVLPPATPPSQCLLRSSLMATHTEPILDEAMDIIQSVMQQIKK